MMSRLKKVTILSRKLILSFLFFAVYTSAYSSFDQVANTNFAVKLVNCPVEARTIVDSVFKAINTVIYTEQTINVEVNFNARVASTVLAAAKATEFVTDFSALAKPGIFYPIALAEKIADTSLNDISMADIYCTVNPNPGIEWEYSLEGLNDPAKLDFFTLFMHEIIHGLGVQSLIQVDGIQVDPSTSFSVYDSYLIDSLDNSLIELHKDGKPLFNILTDSSLHFLNDYGKIYGTDQKVLIYSPDHYTPGNSLHHVDESSYKKEENRLMTPVYDSSNYQRNVDAMSKSILHCIGWNDPVISLSKMYDSESVKDSMIIISQLLTKNLDSNLILEYSFDNFNHFYEAHNIGTRYSIPPSYFNNTVKYRFKYYNSALDSMVYYNENAAGSFYVGIDTIAPSLKYESDKHLYDGETIYSLKGSVSDNLGEVALFASFITPSDTLVKTDSLEGSFSFEFTDFSYKVGDSLLLVIQARDFGTNSNTVIDSVYIMVLEAPEIYYSFESSFDDDSQFILEGFQVNKIDHFSSSSLHSEIFYEAPNEEGDTLFFTAILSPKIVIDDIYHFLEFDEIAFVEPHDEGKLFGQFGFWDYVSVEGSKDGVNWHIFEKEGYDVSLHDDWYELYVNELEKDGENLNSKSIPTESLYKGHRINLVENKFLRKGDTISIRFRMISDAFSNGWGWSIDNLKIQSGAEAQLDLNENELRIVPVPAKNSITVLNNEKDLNYCLYSCDGRKICCATTLNCRIDLAFLPQGVYLVIFEGNIARKIIKN